MRRITVLLKFWVLPISIFLFLLVFTLSLLPTLVNLEKFSPLVEKHLSEVTKRKVKLGTDMTLSFFPWFGLSVSDVTVANVKGFSSDYFAKGKTLEARLKLFPLLRGKLSFKRLVVDGLELNLEKNKDGNVNWDLFDGLPFNRSDVGQDKRRLGQSAALISTSLFAITDGTIHFTDQATDSHHEVDELMLLVSEQTPEGFATLDGKMVINGNPLAFEGQFISSFTGNDFDLEKVVIDISVFDEIKGRFTGSIKDVFNVPRYEFTMILSEFCPEPVLSLVKSPFFFANSGLRDIQDLTIRADVKGNLNHITIENGTASFDKSKVKFSFLYNEEETSRLQFKVAVDFFELEKYLPEKEFQAIGQGEWRGNNSIESLSERKKQPVKVSGLIKFQELRVGPLSFKNVHSIMVSEVGRKYVCKPITFSFYDGSATAELIIDNSKGITESKLVVQAEKVVANSLTQDFLQYPLITGDFSGEASFKTSGSDTDNLLGNLKGQGTLQSQDGQIIGAGFTKLLNAGGIETYDDELEEENQTAIYSDITSEITISEGLLGVSRTTIKMKPQDVSFSGILNLRNKDFTVQLHADQLYPEKGKKRSGNLLKPIVLSGSLLTSKELESSSKNFLINFLNQPGVADVKTLVDEKIPSPEDDDVKDLEGTALIDPEIVAQRIRLHPESLPEQKEKKRLLLGSGKIQINPLIEEPSLKQ